MRTVWRVFAYLKRYPLLATGMLVSAILSTLMVIVFPAVTKLIVDEVLGKHQPGRLTALVLYAASAIVILVLLVRCWKNGIELNIKFGVLLVATVLVSPHLTVYDLVILAPSFLPKQALNKLPPLRNLSS